MAKISFLKSQKIELRRYWLGCLVEFASGSKVLEFENSNGNDTYSFLKQCEKNIYFSEAGEDEAFFKSDNLESIQLCTIHSTKGLAYPMVILANSDKNIYSQIQSDSIESNSFTLQNGEQKLVTAFGVDDYEPLCFRLLKQIDKLKHMAECKISDNVSTCFTFMFPFFQTSFKSVKL